MTSNPDHIAYQPKLYRRAMPILWWLQNRSYFMFIVREMTSVFVGFFAVLYIFQLRALGQGADAYAAFVERLSSPLFIFFHAVSLLFVIYHAITWFNLAPSAIVVRFGERRVPDGIVAGVNYLACVLLSAVVGWILLRG